MKIKSFVFLMTLAIIFGMGSANANMLFDVYAGGTYGVGGYTIFSDAKDINHSSQSYGAVLGMDIPMFRFELEYNYLDTDLLSINTAFINAYFKLPTPIVKPYIGAGVGSTFSSKYEPLKSISIDIEDAMAYQGMLGITIDIPVIPFNIDIEGRALYIPEFIESVDESPDLLQYEGRVKLRYVF